MRTHRSVKGYHGTSIANAQAILQGAFQLSKNRSDWLGDGAYFFEGDPARAVEWSRQRYGDAAAVIEAVISLEEGCMDLLDGYWRGVLVDAYSGFAKRRQAAHRPLPKQDPDGGPHYLDRVIVNRAVLTLKRMGVDIRVIRAMFREGEAIYPDSAFHDKDHIQLAVRHPSCITEKRIMAP